MVTGNLGNLCLLRKHLLCLKRRWDIGGRYFKGLKHLKLCLWVNDECNWHHPRPSTRSVCPGGGHLKISRKMCLEQMLQVAMEQEDQCLLSLRSYMTEVSVA